MSKMRFYDQFRRPPESALKKIEAGRLKGKSDINPQWRIQAMTEVFGPCGIGWYPEITRQWMEPVANGEILAFCNINLFIHDGENWSKPIPGTGGSTLVASEKAGLYNSDEAYKMAYTDALSVAMKSLGVAGDIYSGKHNGTKYDQEEPKPEVKKPDLTRLSVKAVDKAVEGILTEKFTLADLLSKSTVDPEQLKRLERAEAVVFSYKSVGKTPAQQAEEILSGGEK
jgi:hypothetical protein